MQSKLKVALLGILLIPCWVIAVKYDVDLVNLYAAAGFTHTDLHRVYAHNGSLGRYFYGPVSLILISPLAHLSFFWAKTFWIVLQTVSYAVFWYALYQLYPVLKEKKFILGWLVVWIISINPIHNNFQSNNIQLMLAATLLISELKSRESSSRSQWLAGFLVVLAAMIKVYPLFIVAFYILTKPKMVKVGVVTGFVITGLLPFLFFGPENGLLLYRDFLSNLTTYTVENSLTKVPDILNLPSMITRVLSPANTTPLPAVESLSKSVVLLISALFFLWISLKQLKGELKDSRYALHTWALAMALMAFLNPSTRPHYFIFYVPAFCSVLEVVYVQGKGRLNILLVGVATVFVAFTTDFLAGKALSHALEFNNIPTIGFMLLCLALLFTLRTYKIDQPMES